MSMNITESKKIGSFTRIKKCIWFIIASVALIVLSLPVSFAVSSIVSPMSEPTVDKVTDGGNDIYRFYAEFYSNDYLDPPDRVNSKYSVFVYNVVATSGSTVTARPGKISDIICSGGRLISVSADIFDAVSGNLYRSTTFPLKSDGSGTVWAPYFPNLTGSWFYRTDGVGVQGATVPAFIEFSAYPPEHNIYHSELSEPVADEYNSYFICNDKLYWLSYRANGIYSFSNDFELNSQLYSESASFESSGSGSFTGQSGGSTETVTAPYVTFFGDDSTGATFNGIVTSPNFGEIDYVGSSQGTLSVSSNGQMTYNGLNVYPVAINNQILNRLYDVIIYLTDSSGFKIWLCPRSDLGTSLVVDASLYCSVFELTNGQYVSSSFSSYTGSYDHAGFDFPLEDEIADVRCYGCAFYNVNNIPVGLSDVLWAYDLEFVQWRDSMLDKLNQIYSLLSNASVPETTTYSFGEAFENMSNPDFSELSPDQMGVDLNNVWQNSGDSLVSGSSTVKGWMSAFSIPKIISLCVLALATGTVILTLGKNKQDSA